MSVTIEKCPECDEPVALCDNNIRLDVPATDYDPDPSGACWRIMVLTPTQHWAAAGGEPDPQGVGHTLHEHQPAES